MNIKIAFILLLLPLTALSKGLTQKQLDERHRKTVEAYKILDGVLTDASTSKRLNEFLDRMRVPRSLFDRIKSDIAARNAMTLSESEVSYQLTNSKRPECRHLGKGAVVIAYVGGEDQIVRLCDAFFSKSDSWMRAKALLHEHVHLAGVLNECEAEGLATLIFYSMGKKPPVSYSNRCTRFMAYLTELVGRDDTLKNKNELVPSARSQ